MPAQRFNEVFFYIKKMHGVKRYFERKDFSGMKHNAVV